MPRQIFTFLAVFVLMFFVMRSCAPKPQAPPALATEAIQAAPTDVVVLGKPGGPVVTLARDGSIVSIVVGEAQVLRPVNAWRRTLRTFLRFQGGQKLSLPAEKWADPQDAGDKGTTFTFAHDDGTSIKKTVTLDDEGLRVAVAIESPKTSKVEGFEVTGPSGARLARPDDDQESGIFYRGSASDRLIVKRFAALVADREQRRANLLGKMREGGEIPPSDHIYYDVTSLGVRERVERLGVLGTDHYVVAEGFGEARRISIDAYREKRGGQERPQLEPWLSFDLPPERTATLALRLRWGARADVAQLEPELKKKEQVTKAAVHRLENETLRIEFTDRGAAIRGMWLKHFAEGASVEPTEKTWLPILRAVAPPRQRALTMYGETFGLDLDRAVWKTNRDAAGNAIAFTVETPAGYTITKTVWLPEQEDNYALAVEIVVRHASATSAKFTLVGPSAPYLEDSYRGIIGAEPPAGFLLERRGGESDDEYIEKISEADADPFVHAYAEGYARGLLRSVGARGAYFVTALVTEERSDSQGRPAGHVTEARITPLVMTSPVTRPDGETTRASLRTQLSCAVPMTNGEAKATYSLYAGPTELPRLRPLQIEDAVDFGMFGVIGRFLMWLMKTLYGVFGSWGVAIICMTLIVRGALMPVSYRTQLGMMRYSKRIQKIKPLLEDLEKRHSSNRQKLNQERMKVMRENKVGFPLGCLMIFFQFPIWIALFGALRVEFALRHQPFLWATDLSMPDRLFGLPFWPHAFNLLPILMLVLWVTQQKLAPSPGGDDPQVQMQMKMVKFMPYMFFIFLYKYAAALSVYMCVSSAWSIVESKLVRRAIKRAEDAEAGGAAPAPAKS